MEKDCPLPLNFKRVFYLSTVSLLLLLQAVGTRAAEGPILRLQADELSPPRALKQVCTCKQPCRDAARSPIPRHAAKILFVHISKTGGTHLCKFATAPNGQGCRPSIEQGLSNCNVHEGVPPTSSNASWLASWNPHEVVEWASKRASNTRSTGSHIPADFLGTEWASPDLSAVASSSKVLSLTSLREPAARYVSSFHQHCQTSSRPKRRLRKGTIRHRQLQKSTKLLSLSRSRTLLHVFAPATQTPNAMKNAKYGCSEGTVEGYVKMWPDNKMTRQLCGSTCIRVPRGNLRVSHLSKALETLELFDVVLVTELFSASAVLLHVSLGWSMTGGKGEMWQRKTNSKAGRKPSTYADGITLKPWGSSVSKEVRAASELDAHLYVAAGRKSVKLIRLAAEQIANDRHMRDNSSLLEMANASLELVAEYEQSLEEYARVLGPIDALDTRQSAINQGCQNPCCHTLTELELPSLQRGEARTVAAVCGPSSS